MVITLIPKSVAKVNYRFTHFGGVEICEKCPLKNVCIDSLKINKIYEIKSIRKKEHNCLIDNSKMIVCDVTNCNPIITIPDERVMEGVIITRSVSNCNEILCENYQKCLPYGFDKITKVKVLRIIRQVECPLNYALKEIEAEKIEISEN